MYENTTEEILNAQNDVDGAMNHLVEKNSGLIWSIVKRFSGRGYELEELYQIGAIGFVKAIKRFDATFEVKLSTYAVPYMIRRNKKIYKRRWTNKGKQKHKRTCSKNKGSSTRIHRKNRC